MNVWTTTIIIWISTLVFTGWVFYITGSPWSFAILLLLTSISEISGDDDSNKKGDDEDERKN